MKKLSFFSVIAMFALTVVGCSNDNQENDATQGVKVTFEAGYAPDARLNLGGAKGTTPEWMKGDQVGVAELGTEMNVAFRTEDNKAEFASFTGTFETMPKVGTKMKAYYPYLDSGIGLSMKQDQNPDRFGGALVFTAVGEMLEGNKISGLSFHCQSSGIKFIAYGLPEENLKSVTIFTVDGVQNQMTLSDDGNVVYGGNGGNEMSVNIPYTPQIQASLTEGWCQALLAIPAVPMKIQKVIVETSKGKHIQVFTTPKEVPAAANTFYTVKLNLNTENWTHEYPTEPTTYPLYIPGEHNGWQLIEGQNNVLHSLDFGYYSGLVTFNGKFKFNQNNVWFGDGGPVNSNARLHWVGSEADKPELNSDGSLNFEFYVIANINKNKVAFCVPTGGVLIAGKLTRDTAWGFTSMNYNRETKLWEAKSVKLEAGAGTGADTSNSRFLILGAGSYDYKIGGTDVDNLVYEGGDIPINVTGTYDIAVDLSRETPKLTLTKVGE